MTDGFAYLIRALGNLYVLAFILRFLLQWVRADFHNPFCQAIVKITNPLVVPFRKFIPSIRGVDSATLFVIVILQVTLVAVLYLVTYRALPSVIPMLVTSLILIAKNILQLFFMLIIVRVILSWINPGTYNPITSVLYSLTEPLMAPMRRLIPPIGGLDLSPIFIIIAIGALMRMLPLA